MQASPCFSRLGPVADSDGGRQLCRPPAWWLLRLQAGCQALGRGREAARLVDLRAAGSRRSVSQAIEISTCFESGGRPRWAQSAAGSRCRHGRHGGIRRARASRFRRDCTSRVTKSSPGAPSNPPGAPAKEAASRQERLASTGRVWPAGARPSAHRVARSQESPGGLRPRRRIFPSRVVRLSPSRRAA